MGIEESRRTIDRINREMLDLFVERMRAASDIADYKRERGLPVLDPSREREILATVADSVPSDLASYAHTYFSSLMEISRAYQSKRNATAKSISAEISAAQAKPPSVFPKRGKVACQGVEGAYSQIACDKLFGEQHIVYFKSFDAVFSAVQSGLCDFGVLPIENSTHGSVSEVYDLMRQHSFRIVRSMKQKVDHALLVRRRADGSIPRLSEIREIRSHSQALGQCNRFLGAHPEIRAQAVENTAVAAKSVADSERDDLAAIASPACAKLYGLARLDAEIQNSDSNFTRFICIAGETAVYPGADRISLMLTLPNTPGSLHGLLSKLAYGGFNLHKLESRPIEGSDFEVRFYLDFNIHDRSELSILDEIEEACESATFLGLYSEL
jgi:chorismate mutase/prephenate dehydratase